METTLSPVANIWEHLWRKDKNGLSCRINIPDTLVLAEDGTQTLYFTSKKQPGIILKKRCDAETKRYDLGDTRKRFTKGHGIEKQSIKNSRKKSKIVSTMIEFKRNTLAFTHFEKEGTSSWLKRHWRRLEEEEELEYETATNTVVMQRFVVPCSEHNKVIKAEWTPNVCFLHTRQNKYRFDDVQKDPTLRAATYNEPKNLSVETSLKNKTLAKKVLAVCRNIAKHITSHSRVYEEVRAMTLYFKTGNDGNIWLIWARNFQCSTVRPVLRQLDEFKELCKNKKVQKHSEMKTTRRDSTLIELWGPDSDDSWDDLGSHIPKHQQSNINKASAASKGDTKENKESLAGLQNLNILSNFKNLMGAAAKPPMKIPKKLFHCPVENCKSVENTSCARSEAVFKDIIDFYKSGGKIGVIRNLYMSRKSSREKDDTMVGVAPLFGPGNKVEENIPQVLRKYVPGGSVRRYQLLQRDPKFQYRTIRVCSRCANVFMKRVKLSLKNQVAVTSLFEQKIAQRKRTKEIIRLVGGPVVPLQSRQLNRLAEPKRQTQKFQSKRPKSAGRMRRSVSSPERRKRYDAVIKSRAIQKEVKRPKSATLSRKPRAHSQKDREKFDIPFFQAPPMLPKSLKGWVPPPEWSNILVEKRTRESQRSTGAEQSAEFATALAANGRRSRPRSAPARRRSHVSRNRTPKKVKSIRKVYLEDQPPKPGKLNVHKKKQYNSQNRNRPHSAGPVSKSRAPKRPNRPRSAGPTRANRATNRGTRPKSARPSSRGKIKSSSKSLHVQKDKPPSSHKTVKREVVQTKSFVKENRNEGYGYDEHIRFIEHHKKMVSSRTKRSLDETKSSVSSEAKDRNKVTPTLNSVKASAKSAGLGGAAKIEKKVERAAPDGITPSAPFKRVDLSALSPRLGTKTSENEIEASV